jgi:hypothetical protein
MKPLDALHAAGKAVGASPQEILAAMAILRLDKPETITPAAAERLLVGVLELRATLAKDGAA